MDAIKSFDGLQKVTDTRADPLDVVLPCGHTVRQSVPLGCTAEECRPGDEKISAAYWAERLARPQEH